MAVLPGKHHHSLELLFSCLTQLQNLPSIPFWSSRFETQLCWQSCIRLQLQCTSTLHVPPHQQPASLRYYTISSSSPLPFFFALSSSSLYARCIMEEKSRHKNNVKGTPRHQFTSLRRGSHINLWPRCFMCTWMRQRLKHAQRFPPK